MMCQFFSCIAFAPRAGGAIRFCESDSHETIIERLGLDDSAPLETRAWVRAERVMRPSGTWDAVRVDETSAPGWWDDECAERVVALSERVAPAWRAYDEAVAAAQRAYDEAIAPAQRAYDEALAPARRAHDEAIRTIEGYVPAREVA